MKSYKVLVGIPSGSEWKAQFGMSLVNMVAYSSTPMRGGSRVEELRVWNARGSILPKSRTTLAKQALEFGATHLLFVDSDMVFPHQTLHRLLTWNKSVVACNCPTKMLPSTPTARDKGNTLTGVPVYSVQDDVALKQIWRIGTGVMLVDMRVFRSIPEPWFPMEWSPELQDYRGEDWSFCAKLEEHGIPIYIDMGLSRVIGHVGDLMYEHKHVEVPNVCRS